MTDEDDFWDDKAIEIRRSQLDTVRETAGRWQTGISAVVGAFGTAALLAGPRVVKEIPSGAVVPLKVLSVLGGVCALAAVGLALRVSVGVPTLAANFDGRALESQNANLAPMLARRLRASQLFAAMAAATLAAGSVVSLVSAKADSPPPQPTVLVRTSGGGLECGRLGRDDGRLVLLDDDGVVRARLDTGVAETLAVTSCPG